MGRHVPGWMTSTCTGRGTPGQYDPCSSYVVQICSDTPPERCKQGGEGGMGFASVGD